VLFVLILGWDALLLDKYLELLSEGLHLRSEREKGAHLQVLVPVVAMAQYGSMAAWLAVWHTCSMAMAVPSHDALSVTRPKATFPKRKAPDTDGYIDLHDGKEYMYV